MAKDPAFLLYSSDFLTGCVFFTNEEVGVYIRLLCIQHQKGRINPQDFNRFTSGFERVIDKFINDENGYYNLRLENEILKRLKGTESSRNNGHLGGRPKKDKGNNPQVKKTKPIHNPSEDENEDINVFNNFYKEYPKKVAKEAAKKAWKALSKTEKELAISQLPKWLVGRNPDFYPNPATYLNGKRWSDELIVKQSDEVIRLGGRELT